MNRYLERARAFLDAHRRTVRYAIVLAFLVLAGAPLVALVPRPTTFEYDLGAAHGRIRELRLAYMPRGGESARALTVRFPTGAPERYDHAVELAPGTYEIHAFVTGDGVRYEVTRFVQVPRTDETPISLADQGVFGY